MHDKPSSAKSVPRIAPGSLRYEADVDEHTAVFRPGPDLVARARRQPDSTGFGPPVEPTPSSLRFDEVTAVAAFTFLGGPAAATVQHVPAPRVHIPSEPEFAPPRPRWLWPACVALVALSAFAIAVFSGALRLW